MQDTPCSISSFPAPPNNPLPHSETIFKHDELFLILKSRPRHEWHSHNWYCRLSCYLHTHSLQVLNILELTQTHDFLIHPRFKITLIVLVKQDMQKKWDRTTNGCGNYVLLWENLKKKFYAICTFYKPFCWPIFALFLYFVCYKFS